MAAEETKPKITNIQYKDKKLTVTFEEAITNSPSEIKFKKSGDEATEISFLIDDEQTTNEPTEKMYTLKDDNTLDKDVEYELQVTENGGYDIDGTEPLTFKVPKAAE